ncbi:sulfite exporter TauE/SafE family protein [bacterium]|nr:sulfite exporter TauE/SafE family protein [bacterium]
MRHLRLRNVDLRLLWWLGCGGVPGSLLGTAMVGWLRQVGPADLDNLLLRALALILVPVSLSMAADRSQVSQPQAWLTGIRGTELSCSISCWALCPECGLVREPQGECRAVACAWPLRRFCWLQDWHSWLSLDCPYRPRRFWPYPRRSACSSVA